MQKHISMTVKVVAPPEENLNSKLEIAQKRKSASKVFPIMKNF